MFEEDIPQTESMNCKPDPEEQLQRARLQKQHYLRAEELLFELADLPVRIETDRHQAQQMLGFIRIKQRNWDKEIDRWLKEIDSE